MSRRLRLGDVFKLATKKGDAYLQCVASHKTEGETIKVFYRLWSNPAEDVSSIVSGEYFLVDFPLRYAIPKGIVEYVGHSDLGGFEMPELRRTQNYFGTDSGWYVINTRTMKREFFDELNENQLKLSPYGIWNDTLIIEKLEEGWRLEDWW